MFDHAWLVRSGTGREELGFPEVQVPHRSVFFLVILFRIIFLAVVLFAVVFRRVVLLGFLLAVVFFAIILRRVVFFGFFLAIVLFSVIFRRVVLLAVRRLEGILDIADRRLIAFLAKGHGLRIAFLRCRLPKRRGLWLTQT